MSPQDRVTDNGFSFPVHPNLTKHGDGFVYWRDTEVEHYSFRNPRREAAAVAELTLRCLYLEANGIEVNTSTAVWRWRENLPKYKRRKTMGIPVTPDDCPLIVAKKIGECLTKYNILGSIDACYWWNCLQDGVRPWKSYPIPKEDYADLERTFMEVTP